MNEPSVLLVDDTKIHEKYLRMLNLEKEGWIVKVAIDQTINGAVRKAARQIEANDGFTIVLLDILWPTDKFGGVKVLNKLSKKYSRKLPVRKVIIMSRESVYSKPELMRLADVLRMPDELRCLQLTTAYEREQLKKVLLKIWNKIKNINKK
jgi:CheY-like chemotaxis protein